MSYRAETRTREWTDKTSVERQKETKTNKERKIKERKKEENLANVTGHLSKSKGLQALGSLNTSM